VTAPVTPVSASTTPEPVRPSTLTDLLDGGFRLLRSRPGTVLALSALFVVPGQVFAGVANRASIEDLGAVLGGSAVLSAGASSDGYDLLLLLLSALVRSLGLLYLGVALTFVVIAGQAGTRMGASEAAVAALKRSGPVLGAWPLLALASLVSYVACVLPLGVWLTFTAVVAPVVAAERAGPIRAIGRSFRLVAKRFWAALGVVLLSTLVAGVLDSVLLIVPQGIAVALPSPYGWVLAMVASAAVSTVTTGPLVLSCVLLYVDLRVRVDGLDLRQRAQAAFSRGG
jgi:hypothetical protein